MHDIEPPDDCQSNLILVYIISVEPKYQHLHNWWLLPDKWKHDYKLHIVQSWWILGLMMTKNGVVNVKVKLSP
jgi:hypothetical protein